MYVVKEKSYAVVDKSGKTLIKGFDSIKSIDGENAIVKVDGKYGVKNSENKEVIKANYQDLTYAFGNYYSYFH